MIGLKMVKENKLELIEKYLESLYPNPVCELNYSSDYELLIAVVLSAQTTDKRVNMVTSVLFKKYPTLEEIKEADMVDLEGVIYSLGTSKRKSLYVKEIARMLVDEYNSVVPSSLEELLRFPGVGRKVANVVLGELFKMPAIAVDTHVERVSKRLGLADKDDSVLEVEKKLMTFYKEEDWARRHLQMVLFGRYHCKSRNPLCDECKLKDICVK